MLKKLSLLATAGFISYALAAEVNLYSARHYEGDNQIYEAFEKKTGIKVNVIQSKADALLNRMQSEGKDSPADLFITVDAARIYKAQQMGIFQSIESKILEERIPAHLRDKDNQWFAVTKRARVIAVDKNFKVPEPFYYEDLAKPEYKNAIMVRSSSSPYNQSLLAAYIAHNGVENAQNWASGIVANLARDPKGSDRDQSRAVANGIGKIAITNSYYMGKLANGKEADKDVYSKLKIIFPKFKNGATHINVSAIGVTKFAKNKQNAIKFIEFLTSDEIQKKFAAGNFEYPVVKGVELAPIVKSWGSFKEDDLSINKLGENNAQAVKIFDKAKWK